MKWEELEHVWQKCFELGWQSFKEGSLPFGAVIADKEGNILSTGRNTIYSKDSNDTILVNSTLAHAEMNALLSYYMSNTINKDVTLYCTTEPCPMCFGTFIMSNIKNLVYACSENYAGSTDLINGNDYMLSKKERRSIEGPIVGLEDYQMVLDTLFMYNKYGFKDGFTIEKHKAQYPISVLVAKKIYKDNLLSHYIESNNNVGVVFNYINELLDEDE